jgi:hypothetical protein
MGLKKTELYRGFNVFTEQVRTGIWAVSVIEIPSSEGTAVVRAPSHGRVPGEHPSKEAAVTAARAQVDRIHKNRLNRANRATS